MYKNQINDISALKNLTNLAELDLKYNQISDISTLENMTKLTRLSLMYNQINDISALKNLTNLNKLYLEQNQINDISALEKMQNLTDLALGLNEISDISVLSNLTNLNELYLEQNQINDIRTLENLTNLTWLYLDSNQISDISALKDMTNLTYLNLAINQISDINVLKKMTNLKQLVLSENQISDISALKNLTNLKDLNLSENQISDISALENLTSLTELDLEENKITKEVCQNGIQEIELPQIITEAKRQDSKIYTNKDYILENCELTSDGKKITIDTSKVGTASIKIGGGNASGTTFTINVVKDTTPPVVSVKKSIETLTNQNVTVTITADEEIQKVEGWDLSEGKTILTKEYTKNGEETVKVKDLAGNETPVKVVVNNIDKDAPKLTVTTSTKEVTNKDVTVTITADEEIQIVEGWTLSEDKKVLTKTYKENKTETVVVKDLAGNTTSKEIVVNNINKLAPTVKVKYSAIELTNQNVTVTITADKEIQKVEGWNLSEDKKVLTKEYTQNGEETVEIKDLAGNTIKAEVKVNNIDKVAPKIEINYSTTEKTNKNVIVTIKVDEEIKIPEKWNLDKESGSIYREYDANTEEELEIEDLAGNKTVAKIKITNIDKTVSKDPLADTGKISSFIIFAFIIICAVIFYKKYNKYRDIK